MPTRFFRNIRNKRKLLDGEYSFFKEKDYGKKTIWRCDEYSRWSCKVRVHTTNVNDEIVKRMGEHSHDAEPDAWRTQAVNGDLEGAELEEEQVRKCAETETEEILGSETSSPAAGSTVPSSPVPTVETNGGSTRNDEDEALDTLNVPFDLQTTESGARFLLFDSARSKNLNAGRVLIFSTADNLHLLSRSSIWSVSGDFKTGPPSFRQLYVIYAVLDDGSSRLIPSVYAFLARKDEETLRAFVDAFVNLRPDLCPNTIVSDFDALAMRVFRAKFPEAALKGGFHHFRECVYRAIRAHGLHNRYKADAEFSLRMRMIGALPFLPVSSMVEGFELLRSADDDFPVAVQLVLNYVEQTFVGGKDAKSGSRRSPLYAHSLWSCFYDACYGGVVAGNYGSFEGWRRHLLSRDDAQLTIDEFLTAIKREQRTSEKIIKAYRSGCEVAEDMKMLRPAPIFMPRCEPSSAERIENIVKNFECDVLKYLRDIANNFYF